jgi:hypothetical protein
MARVRLIRAIPRMEGGANREFWPAIMSVRSRFDRVSLIHSPVHLPVFSNVLCERS